MTKRLTITKVAAKVRRPAAAPRPVRRERLIGSEVLQPATIVGGVLAHEGSRTLLLVGGLSLEVLSAPAIPETPARWAEARRRTHDIFANLNDQHVLLRTRQIGGVLVSASALQMPGAAPPSSQDAVFASINDVIARRSHELLGLPGVLAVRPGYRFRNRWITNEPCVVALVQRKISDADLPQASRIPERLDAIAVDVAPAGPVEQLLASDKSSGFAPEDLANPFGYALPGVEPATHEAFSAQLIRTSKYKPPPDASLDPVSGPMKVLCHVSPDAGWPVLKDFLQQTQTNLRVAMYDFTAPHIVRDLESVLVQSGKIELVLDPGLSLTAGGRGENPKSGDWTEEDVKAVPYFETLGSLFLRMGGRASARQDGRWNLSDRLSHQGCFARRQCNLALKWKLAILESARHRSFRR
jgi:hypothetical protein